MKRTLKTEWISYLDRLNSHSITPLRCYDGNEQKSLLCRRPNCLSFNMKFENSTSLRNSSNTCDYLRSDLDYKGEDQNLIETSMPIKTRPHGEYL
ncbi:hypothetical protein TNCV_3683911 [Trichonephila clavipes]|nr:hypothetical protein TNCV_3683911 [Trichonephila clavipes]